jgi:hypothetical protein
VIAVAPRTGDQKDVEMSDMTGTLAPPSASATATASSVPAAAAASSTGAIVESPSLDDNSETKIVIVHDGPTVEASRPGTSGGIGGQAELSHVAISHDNKDHLTVPTSGSVGLGLGDLNNPNTRAYSDSRDSIGDASDTLQVNPSGGAPADRRASTSARISVSQNDNAENALLGNNNREPASFNRQFIELFRKRYLCALRDMKGRFFEIILPVGIVALVLLILLINASPAGPSITLNANLYSTGNFTLYHLL